MRISDWSSDVCSSDLRRVAAPVQASRMACGRARLPGGVDAEEEWQARRRMLDQGEQQVQLSRQVRRSSGVGAFQALDAPKWRESDGVKGNRPELWTQAGAQYARGVRRVSEVRGGHRH